MKTEKITLAVLITFLTIGIYSCKKYEEGPALSLRTKKARVAGTWKVEKFIDDNGIDRTTDWKNRYASEKIEFGKDGSYNGSFINTVVYGGQTKETAGTWEFDDKKTLLLWPAPINPVSTPGTISTGGSTDNMSDFKILKLSNKEIWIRSDLGTEEYHLVPSE